MDRIDVLQRATQRSFGYQWIQFADIVEANREHFLRYIAPVEPSFFKGKLGLDAACGCGRHLYYAREFGARMVGVDFSDTIRSAGKVVGDQPGASLVKGDLYRLPFRPESFNFIYCLGRAPSSSRSGSGFPEPASLRKKERDGVHLGLQQEEIGSEHTVYNIYYFIKFLLSGARI